MEYTEFQVQASAAISLIQSDIKAALRSAFGSFDGPLPVTDWCRCRGQSGDVSEGFLESSASVSECRDSSSTVTLSAVEPISPLQSSAGGSSCLKGIVLLMYPSNFCKHTNSGWLTLSSETDGTRADETSERRSNQDISISESEQQLGSRLGPTLLVLPFPAILVGYECLITQLHRT